MDAICFVFGVSAKHLRGDKLKDLVWRAAGKAGAGARAAKSASVTVVYVVDEGEIEGRSRGSEVRFSRSVTPAGASQYRIDGKEQTWEAYSDALEGINIVTKARNFLVFQGDVESLAAKDEKSLQAHLETVCGSADLKEEYDAAYRDLLAAREDVIAKRHAANATRAERKALKSEKVEADAYAAKVSAREAERVQFALWKLFHLEFRVRVGEKALEAARVSLTEAAVEESEAATKLAELAKALAKAQKDVSAREKSAAAAARESLKCSTAEEELKTQIAALTARLEEFNAARKKAAAAAALQAEEVESLTAEVTAAQDALNALENGVSGASDAHGATKGRKSKSGNTAAVSTDAAAPKIQLSAADRAAYNTLKSKERAQTADARAALEVLLRSQSAEETSATELRDSLETLANRRAAIATELAAARDKLATLSAHHDRAVAERADKNEELATSRAALEVAQKRHEEIGVELEEVKAALSAHKDARRRTDAEARAENAVDELKRLYPGGVRGRLVELVTPTAKRFALAVSIALGKHMDAVVVDTEDVAFASIRWLRENKVRPLTFIPLDRIKSSLKEPDDRLAAYVNRDGSHFRFVRDVVKFDPELESAVLFAAGTTVVCDSLADAKELRFKRNVDVKCVTLDGTIIAKNGNMTGGISAADRDSAAAGRWDEKELRSAQARRDMLLQEEERLRRSIARGGRAVDASATSLHTVIEDITNALATNAARVAVMAGEMKRLGERIKDLETEDKAAAKTASKSQPDLDKLEASISARSTQIEASRSQINAVTDGVFTEFCSAHGLTSIRDYEVAVVERGEADAKAKRALTDTLNKLTMKLEYTRGLNRASALADIDKRISATKTQIAEATERVATVAASAASAKADEAKAKDGLVALKASLREYEAAREAASERKRAAGERKASLAKDVTQREGTLESAVGERHDELLRAQMDKIVLPLKAGAADEGGVATKNAAGGRRSSEASRRRSGVDSTSGANGDNDVKMGGVDNVFSQAGVSATSSQTSSAEGGVGESAEAADARRSERIDFDALTADVADLTPAEIEERSAVYERRIHEMAAELSKLNPNMKAGQQLEEVEARLAEENAAYETAREASAAADVRFADVRSKRLNLFHEAFDAVAGAIGRIYSQLTVSQFHPMGGSASLSLMNRDDPFTAIADDTGGVRFSVQPPGKKFSEINILSGGEKTVAALAMLFALHYYRPSPFLIMDEIDAALDPVNVHKVTQYIVSRAMSLRPSTKVNSALADTLHDSTSGSNDEDKLQVIVVSLKDVFFERASGLVGVYRDCALDSSGTLTLDLNRFVDGSQPAAAAPAVNVR